MFLVNRTVQYSLSAIILSILNFIINCTRFLRMNSYRILSSFKSFLCLCCSCNQHIAKIKKKKSINDLCLFYWKSWPFTFNVVTFLEMWKYIMHEKFQFCIFLPCIQIIY